LCFNRPIYLTKSLRPDAFDFGLLKAHGELWVAQFDNREILEDGGMLKSNSSRQRIERVAGKPQTSRARIVKRRSACRLLGVNRIRGEHQLAAIFRSWLERCARADLAQTRTTRSVSANETAEEQQRSSPRTRQA
jgi:hypothetical protein